MVYLSKNFFVTRKTIVIFVVINQLFQYMSHLTFSLNLIKLKNAGISCLNSARSGITKKCLIIPIEDNKLFVTEKGVYLNLIAFESNKLENQSHLIKQSFSKEELEKMSDNEKNSYPSLGGINKLVEPTGETYTSPKDTEAKIEKAPIDDLPF